MISLAIGEPVTIDKAVFNEVHKLNIDFFGPKDSTGSDKSLKNIMYDVVNTWYGIFRNIAITVYLIILVYIGIKILFASTGSTKADYKKTFMAWVMGVAMLMFFPYVMKYAIELNNAFCIWLGEGLAEIENKMGNFGSRTESSELKDEDGDKMNLIEGAKYYGNYEFVMLMLEILDERDLDGNGEISEQEADSFAATAFINNVFGSNAMMRIRFIAQATLDFPLTMVYFILIGQLLAILIVYYKRVFMLAFLITLFPLVMITYPLNRIGDLKVNSFGIWFKEFIVNVLVQAFHAVTYVVVVSIGINSYLQNDNWLFMILCILFLFEGEKIIRAIFNVKSGANTIGDLAVAGAMASNVAGKMFPKGGGGSKAKNAENPESKAKGDREKAASHARPGQTRSASENIAAATAGDGNGATGSADGAGGGGSPKPQLPVSPAGQFDSIKKNVDSWRPKTRRGKIVGYVGKGAGYLAGKAVKWTAKGTGAVLGFTLGAAQGKAETAIGVAVSGAKMGESVGAGITGLAGGIAGKARDIYAAGVVAEEYLNGEHDEELGIREADSEAEKAKAEAMRKIAAKVARRKGRSGDTSAEIKFIKDSLDRLKKE